ncbi:MAG: N-acetyltransferase family protein [Dehalococcoidia bacterium]
MSAGLAVRVAGPEDMSALLRLFRGFMAYLGDPSPPDDALADAITPVFLDPRAEILIGEIDGDPVAYAHVRYHYSVWMAGPECFLEDLFVFEHRRDGGIGRRMLGVVFDRARERGCRRVRLDTNEENQRGMHLYEAVGFSCTRDSYDGGRQLYYTAYLDER